MEMVLKPSRYANVDIIEVLQTLGNTIRKAIVTSLAMTQHPLRFSDLMEASGLNPNFDTGQFHYHLDELLKKNIIAKVDNRYCLTQFGFKLSKLLESIEREYFFLLSGIEANDDMLFQHLEEEARAAGENALYIHVSHREHRFIDFLIRRGYDTLNMLELAKYLNKLPEPYSGQKIEIEGHVFKLR